jgi:hypothetical protein
MKNMIHRHWFRLAILGAIVAVLLGITLSDFARAQIQALELIGVRPFIRLQGTEAGGQTYEIRENAGTLSVANVTLGLSQTPTTVIYAVGNGGGSCTAAGTDETLLSYTIPANTLSANYKGVSIEAWGAAAGNGNNKTVKIIVGGTTVISSGVIALNNQAWLVRGTYLRTGAATEDSAGVYQNSTPTTVGPTRATGTDATTAAIVARVTATCPTANADILAHGMVVKLIN